MTDLIPVTSAPLLDPGQARRDLQVPAGLTVEQIVALALPGLAAEDRHRLRVTLVTERGMSAPDHRHWSRLRPRLGARVVIRLVPGNDPTLRAVLLVAVAVAAIVVAPYLAPYLAGGALGLDVGGSDSVIALARRGGIDIVANEASRRQTPTVVAFDGRRRWAGEGALPRIDPLESLRGARAAAGGVGVKPICM